MPTVAGSGFLGFESLNWFGLLAPNKTPPDNIARLHAETAAVMREPTVRDRLAAENVLTVVNTPAEFAVFVKEQVAKWAVLGKKGLSAINLAQIGDQALELANDVDVDVDEIKRVSIPEGFDEASVLKSMIDTIRRFAANKRRQEARFRKKIAPFSVQIENIVTAFLKGKPK